VALFAGILLLAIGAPVMGQALVDAIRAGLEHAQLVSQGH
jgi:flagellar biosynthetic protein FliR